MRLFKLLFILGILLSENIYAQGIDTDSTKHYLIMRAKNPIVRSRIFGEGKRLMLFHKDKSKFRGRLYFINDTTIQLINAFTLKSDTFKLSDISKVKNSTLAARVGSLVAVSIGILMIKDGYDIYNSNSFFGEIFGNILIGSGIIYITGGILSKDGRTLNFNDFDLKQHTTKGYKLKHKHLRYLYPRK